MKSVGILPPPRGPLTCTMRESRNAKIHETLAARAVAPVRAAMLKGFEWNRRCITARFLGGAPELQAQVKYYARQWERYGALTLNFVENGPADLRIAFEPDGSWSYIGMDALNIPQDEPTMNFGWLHEDWVDRTEIRRVVLHEFGHAFAFIHEHQNPNGGIQWNRDAVYAYYMGAPNFWSREDVDHNIFATYARDQINGTQYDPKSIMIYPIPPEFVLDPAQAAGWNDRLSQLDKNHFAATYPKRLMR